MSGLHPPVSLLLERQNPFARDLRDFRGGQHQIVRIPARNLEASTRALDANTRALDGLRGEIEELRREVRDLGAEQASLAMKVEEAFMRAAQVDRRMDDRSDGQPPAGSA